MLPAPRITRDTLFCCWHLGAKPWPRRSRAGGEAAASPGTAGTGTAPAASCAPGLPGRRDALSRRDCSLHAPTPNGTDLLPPLGWDQEPAASPLPVQCWAWSRRQRRVEAELPAPESPTRCWRLHLQEPFQLLSLRITKCHCRADQFCGVEHSVWLPRQHAFLLSLWR